MSGNHSRRKGARFERAVANELAAIWPGARRRGGAQADGRGIECDVEGTPYWIECKRCAKPPSVECVAAWHQKATAVAKKALPRPAGAWRTMLVVYKADRYPAMVAMLLPYLDGGTDVLVTMPLSQWLAAHR